MTRPTEPSVEVPIDVLIVDAEAAGRAAVADALSSPACRVVAAASGGDGLRQLLKREFALILLAVDLPGLDGVEVAALIRQVRRFRHIPIGFLVSPGAAARPVFRNHGSGFVAWLEKPVDGAELQTLVAAARARETCDPCKSGEVGRVGEDLEWAIRERTASLIAVNDDLRREVARRERAEAALDAARREAEAANAAKSEFLANMSHEIRTPMNGIAGLLELVLRTPLSAEQREYLNLVKVSADALLTIINDILDFSKIEAGSLELERTAFSLRETLGDTLKALAFDAGRKGIEIGCEIDPPLPDRLLGDPVRLRQIVTNLVGNAIKFTASGEVVLSVRGEAGRDGEIFCEFIVLDTGIGIPAEKLKAIFAPFFQADTSTTRLYGGTGLGLTIAARLVEIMGGSISVDSAVGHGSTFRFGLRFGVADESAEAREPRCDGMRVLVVAHPVNRRSIVADLTRWGAEVLEMDDAEAALGIDGVKLAILDDSVADGDVFALAERVRRGGYAGAIAVLGSIAVRREPPEYRAGAEIRCLTKPVKRSELAALMNAVAGRELPAPSPARTSPVPDAGRGLDVLLVEDNFINSRLAQQVLERAGHRVAMADSGTAALAALALRNFDVVLMDVQMPGMDGVETTRVLRERERLSGGRVPVIALTAHAMGQHRERCLAAGMDGFLVKPIRPQELLGAVAVLRPPTGPAAALLASAGIVLDRAALMDRIGGDLRLLSEVIELFGENGRRLLAEARAAADERRASSCAQAIHTLSGMLGSLAANGAADLARHLETSAADGRWPTVEEGLDRLEWDIERLEDELAAIADEGSEEGPDDERIDTTAPGTPPAEIWELERFNE